MENTSLDHTEFASIVTAITGAFGDPTRREIYHYIREREEGTNASQVAEAFRLHKVDGESLKELTPELLGSQIHIAEFGKRILLLEKIMELEFAAYAEGIHNTSDAAMGGPV